MQHAMDKRPRIRGYYVSGRLKVGWAWGWKFPRRHSKHQAKLVDHDHTPVGGSALLDLDARNAWWFTCFPSDSRIVWLGNSRNSRQGEKAQTYFKIFQ